MGKKRKERETEAAEMEEFEEETVSPDTKEYGKPRHYDPNFSGPVEKRSCTDIICCILFLVFVTGMVIISVLAYARGNPYRLIYPTDSNGDICGLDNLKDKPYLFFFDLLECAKRGLAVAVTGCPTPQVCVSKCPDTNYVYWESYLKEKIKGDVDETERAKLICKYNINPLNDTRTIDKLVESEDCASYYVESASIVSRCIPAVFGKLADLGSAIVTSNGTEIKNQLNETITGKLLENATVHLAELYKVKEYGELIFKDVVASWHLVLIGLAMAMVISLVWIILMRWLVGIMVWTALFAFIALFAFGAYYSFSKYYELKSSNVTAELGLSQAFALNFDYYLSLKQTWLAFGCTTSTILVLFVLILIFLVTRICLAIKLLSEGSKAIGYMMSTLLWPVIPFLLQVIVVIYYGSSAVFIASMGETKYNLENVTASGVVGDVTNEIPCTPGGADVGTRLCHFVKYGGNEYTFYLQIFMLFMFFWLMNFIVALGQMTLAGAFASYYWAYEKPRDIPAAPLTRSLYRSLRYHLGTLAFGSLIIAIIQIIRAFLGYLDRKLKSSENAVAKFIVKCLRCCFWCLEKILKFINKNAYIMTSIYGLNFCSAAKEGFFLIMRNIIRTLVLDRVADFIMLVSKLMVTGAVGVGAFFWFQAKIPFFENFVPTLTYYLVPVIILIIGTFLIATTFFNVYSMAVDTLFLCFLEELERKDQSQNGKEYMSKGLKRILKKSNKKGSK
ncbi:choline transporter-like protein 2 [Gigantopelta aegis]|uniref:choline transporter-like protein 2 n=1 Tax=Gigantopelta aegis TaxID=1735272 RepID=UPI001B888644|nr:choline transporter-like protein 2 [Gigantopelta aegis]